MREAFVELRLRRAVDLAIAHQCAAANQGVANLDAEDKAVPFTFNGFASFIKGIRFQYWVGVVEFNCVDENAARRRWEKLAKASQPVASTDHAYPYWRWPNWIRKKARPRRQRPWRPSSANWQQLRPPSKAHFYTTRDYCR